MKINFIIPVPALFLVLSVFMIIPSLYCIISTPPEYCAEVETQTDISPEAQTEETTTHAVTENDNSVSWRWVCFPCFFRRNRDNIFSGIAASVVFSISVFAIGFISRNFIDRKTREYIYDIYSKIDKRDRFRHIDKWSAIQRMKTSLSDTKKVFIRIGKFINLSKDYKDAISSIILDENVWDYHIHLLGPDSRNIEFLKNFCEIDNKGVNSLKQFDTSQIVEIQSL